MAEQLVKDEEKRLYCLWCSHITAAILKPLNDCFCFWWVRTIRAMQFLYIFPVNSLIAFGGLCMEMALLKA